MEVHTNIPLKNFTTMKLGGPARFMAEARTPEEVKALYENASSKHIPVFVLGGGSNVIARDEGYAGMIIRIRIPGFDVIADDINTTTIKIGAGENWDSVVKRTVDMHLSGIEAMSWIPGTAGAAPVQNVGAYGQEIADTLVSLEAYDAQTKTFVVLQNEACGFAYRDSIFRRDQKGRYIITSITLKLSKSLPQPPFYDALQTYFEQQNIKIFTQETIRDAVIAIRTEKLPDPTVTPNTGSFFKNAIVENWQLTELRQKYPDVTVFDMGNGTSKVPTGWLIEHTGLKGQLLHGMRVHDKNALVLINESATGYADLAAARDQIIGAVRDTFRIQIEQEPLELA
ncbi:MAG: UDP-N-acetylmuramate dehydrogenase [Candidatus Microsaccharimonas sossegonensis]|uniref:UDP-N-acetylenolpyruvoylglucosamine reductase n=1 Tax=Candidatus Microsaccharimonas sossegonensis TaxID=2506948 RepID=A0A4V1J7C5_9BACT|nr:MAG: UDP-N-acetylmuramate dehydrogenase [Candidatus Microsaccharimonas sossegonensis]